MTTKLNWIENKAQQNLAYRLQVHKTLMGEAKLLLWVILIILATLCFYALPAVAGTGIQLFLGATLCVVLVLIVMAIALVVMVFALTKTMPPGNAPQHLNLPNYTMAQLQQFELVNIQKSILFMSKENRRLNNWITRMAIQLPLLPVYFFLIIYF